MSPTRHHTPGRPGKHVEAPTAVPTHLSNMVEGSPEDFKTFDREFISLLVTVFGMSPQQAPFQQILARLQPVFRFISQLHVDASGREFFGNYSHGPERDEAIHQFATRFATYVHAAEDAIVRTKEQVELIPNAPEHFRPGWEQRFRNAMYLAFVTHYGQERKSEVDVDGKPLPYIWHPFRAATDVLPQSFGLLAEETSEATVLHDALEDIGKGFLVTHYGFTEDQARVHLLNFIRDHVQLKAKNAVSISKLLYAVDNRRAVEILGRPALNRNETMMCRMFHLTRMSETDFSLYYPHVLGITVDDRLQNGRTIETHNPKRFAAIWLETSFVYSWLTRYFSMTNCAESLYDLLQHVNADERTKMESSRQSDEAIYKLPEKFCEDIYMALERDGFSRQDLHITFRPRGIRFIDPNMPSDGLDFNNFVNFIPTCRSPSKNAELAESLKGILIQLFPYPADGLFDEQKTDFGKQYEYLSDMDGEKRYGYVVARIFQDKADYTRSYFGDVHAAVHLQDGRARSKLRQLQYILQSYVEGPLRCLLFVDHHSVSSGSSKLPEGVTRYSRAKVKEVLGGNYVLPSAPFQPHEQQILRRIIYTLFYLFFKFHKDQVQLVDKGVDVRSFAPSFAPHGMPIATALLMHDPQALLRTPLFAAVERNPLEGAVGENVWDKDDLTLVEKPADFAETPFGADLKTGVLRYAVDRDAANDSLAIYLSAVCQEMLRVGLANFVLEGHVQGDVPQRVAEIGMEV